MKMNRKRKTLLKWIGAFAAVFMIVASCMMPADYVKAEVILTPSESGERILFVGDSRSVDMFSATKISINKKYKDGINVYARDSSTYEYLVSTVSKVGTENFDTLVSWMGVNDVGNLSSYKRYYNSLLKEGKRIVFCTLGPLRDTNNDAGVKRFNNAMQSWAYRNDVDVLPVYKYVKKNIQFDDDGIHYMPKPTKKLWVFIVKKLDEVGVEVDL